MTVLPYAVAYVVTVAVSFSADRYNARALHSAIFATIGALGSLVSAVLPPDAYSHRYGCPIVAASGAFSCIPPLLGWLSMDLFSTASVGLAIALNISDGAHGHIAGVSFYRPEEKTKGWLSDGALDKRCVAALRSSGMFESVGILSYSEQEYKAYWRRAFLVLRHAVSHVGMIT